MAERSLGSANLSPAGSRQSSFTAAASPLSSTKPCRSRPHLLRAQRAKKVARSCAAGASLSGTGGGWATDEDCAFGAPATSAVGVDSLEVQQVEDLYSAEAEIADSRAFVNYPVQPPAAPLQIEEEGREVAVRYQGVYEPASLSRVFAGVPPVRQFVRKIGKPSGPASLFMVLVGMTVASATIAWKKTVSACRGCSLCHGFGINRCSLCQGKGRVGWEAKFDHQDRCPMCFGKRYVNCCQCGGKWHRCMFSHHHRDSMESLFEPKLKPVSKNPIFPRGPSVLDD